MFSAKFVNVSRGSQSVIIGNLQPEVRIDAPKKTEVDAIADRRFASGEKYLQCQCGTLKDFVITNAPMVSNAI
jgi:hypothetical protein